MENWVIAKCYQYYCGIPTILITLKRASATPCACFEGRAIASAHFVKQSLTVRMYWLPLLDVEVIGPTKSIPIWYHGDFTSTGWSSGVVDVIFLFILWQAVETNMHAKSLLFMTCDYSCSNHCFLTCSHETSTWNNRKPKVCCCSEDKDLQLLSSSLQTCKCFVWSKWILPHRELQECSETAAFDVLCK